VAHLGDKDTGRGHSWELLLLGEHGLWQAPLRDLARPTACRDQCWDTSGKVANWTGTQPTCQQTGRLKLPETTVASRRSPARHRDRTQLHPPTGGHQPNCPAVLLQALDKPHLPGADTRCKRAVVCRAGLPAAGQTLPWDRLALTLPTSRPAQPQNARDPISVSGNTSHTTPPTH